MSQEAPKLDVLGNSGIPPVPQSGHPEPLESPLDYNKKTSKYLGIAQISIGIICVFINSLLVAFHIGNFKVYLMGYGIWGGALFITVGAMQIVLVRKDLTRALMITLMVTAIVAACIIPIFVMFCMIDIQHAWSTKALMTSDEYESTRTHICTVQFLDPLKLQECQIILKKNANVRLTLGSIMVTLVFIELILSIATSALCCNVVCCRKTKHPIQQSKSDVAKKATDILL